MHIGICGPMSLSLLRASTDVDPELGDGYAFPFTSHLVLELVRRGHDVDAFTLADTTTEVRRFEAAGPTTGGTLTVSVGPYRLRARDRARDVFKVERGALLGCMLDQRPDVVHALWTYEFTQAALASGLPTLVTAQDWPPLVFRMTPDRYRAMRLLQGMATIARVRDLTAPSPYLASKFSRYGKAVQVIPNGVPAELIAPRVPCAELVAPRLGSINNGWGRRKNVATLLEAFAVVRRQWPEAELVLIGEDYGTGGVAERWARPRGLAAGVRFAGRMPPGELARELADLDLLVHPSLEETFGVVLVEAMAAGVPVVAGRDSGATSWVLGDGEDGAVVDVRDASRLAQVIDEVLADPARRIGYAERGAERVRRCFTIATVAAAFEARYEDLLEQAGRGTRPRRARRRLGAGGAA